jgi:arylsulfatase A-like enzyme
MISNDFRRFLLSCLAFATGLIQCQATSSRPGGDATGLGEVTDRTKRPPNIVYIMADELGYFELSCMGHPHIQTPNIDRMAAEGMRFTQCLAGSSLCAPTRCTLLTGKHSGHASVRSNGGGTPLRAGELTIGSVLKTQGYATGGFGKWGCGGRGSTGVPEEHGFDTFLGYYDQVHAHTYYPAYLVENSQERPLAGNKGGSKGQTYSQYVIHNAAKKFIRDNRDKPFFCYLPVTPPHGLFNIPDEDPAWKIYKDKPWNESSRRYAAMVTMLDRQVGEILTLLEELGLADNTLVMFAGDNGGNDYFRDAGHPRGFHGPNVNPRTGVAFRGHKGNLYEGGLRIPMIARWPGRIAKAQVSDHLCYFPDLLPTFAEIAKAEVPNDIDGISFLPELLGAVAAGRAQAKHEYLYWELGVQIAVRYGDFKAVRAKKSGAWALYDLSKDIAEKDDVAFEHPDLLKKLQGFAAAAHQPVESGTFADRSNHEKDRRAKGVYRRGGKKRSFPKRGVIPRTDWKVLRVGSENTAGGKSARNVLDGDSRTHWHTTFGSDTASHPHELVLDMGAQRRVRGLLYLARQDSSWNGSFGKCEVYVGDNPATLGKEGKPHGMVTFERKRSVQRVAMDPVKGRYLLIRVLSEVADGPWASAAEIGVLGK